MVNDNDCTERGIALLQKYNEATIKNEDQKQFQRKKTKDWMTASTIRNNVYNCPMVSLLFVTLAVLNIEYVL